MIDTEEGFSQERMQLNQGTMNTFANEYTLNIIKASNCAAPIVSYMAAKMTIEDMGYDYDRTFRYFVLFQESLYASEESYDIVDLILTYYEFSAWNLKKAFDEKLISDETYKITNYDLEVRKYNINQVQALLYLSDRYNTTSFSNRQVIEGLMNLNYDNSNLYDKKTHLEETDKSVWNSMFSDEFQALFADEFLLMENDSVNILKPEGLNKIVTMADYLQKARSNFTQ
jgi:hypothetical protein